MSIPRHPISRSARSGPRSRRRLLQGSAALAAGAAGAGTLASCGSARARPGATEIDYWLWDALQLPAYSAAIDLFMEQNPDVYVRITQLGWDDYWTKLTASFVGEAGPDAFADHLEAGLGRLLDEADGQLRGRGRPRCLRRSPGALPRVRPARGDLPAGWSGPARRNPAGAIPRGSAGAVDRRGRSSLRPAQGLRHDRDHVRPEDARGGGSDARGPRGPGLEPRGRRHLRADARATEPRRERGARGRGGFRSHPGGPLRHGRGPGDRLHGSDQLVSLRPVDGLDLHRRGDLGAAVQLRRRPLLGHHGLVLRPGRQGFLPALR